MEEIPTIQSAVLQEPTVQVDTGPDGQENIGDPGPVISSRKNWGILLILGVLGLDFVPTIVRLLFYSGYTEYAFSGFWGGILFKTPLWPLFDFSFVLAFLSFLLIFRIPYFINLRKSFFIAGLLIQFLISFRLQFIIQTSYYVTQKLSVMDNLFGVLDFVFPIIALIYILAIRKSIGESTELTDRYSFAWGILIGLGLPWAYMLIHLSPVGRFLDEIQFLIYCAFGSGCFNGIG